MTLRALIPLTALLFVACGPADEDEDGYSVDDDCDDTNADINPGATEVVGDGIDSDCDGQDPPHPFVGDWSLASVTMDAGEGDILGEATTTGSLQIGDDLSVTSSIVATQDGQSLGFAITGDATPDGGAGDFDIELSAVIETTDGDLAGTGDWSCTTTATAIDCSGDITLTDEDGVIQVVASFEE